MDEVSLGSLLSAFYVSLYYKVSLATITVCEKRFDSVGLHCFLPFKKTNEYAGIVPH